MGPEKIGLSLGNVDQALDSRGRSVNVDFVQGSGEGLEDVRDKFLEHVLVIFRFEDEDDGGGCLDGRDSNLLALPVGKAGREDCLQRLEVGSEALVEQEGRKLVEDGKGALSEACQGALCPAEHCGQELRVFVVFDEARGETGDGVAELFSDRGNLLGLERSDELLLDH